MWYQSLRCSTLVKEIIRYESTTTSNNLPYV